MEGDMDQHFSEAVQLVTSVSLPMVLYTAVKLKLFEIVAKAGDGEKLSSTQIAAQLPAENPESASMLDRMLLLLSSHSVFTCDVLEVACEEGVGYERVYGLSPLGEFFLPDEEGNTVGHLAEMAYDKAFIDSWDELGNALLEGGVPAFNRTHGMPIFEFAGRDAKFNEIFNKGMVSGSSIAMKQLVALNEYKGFEDIHTLVDVGGGLGLSLQRIISKYPSVKGINFDLPHVIKNAPSYPGVKHIGGNMFESVPQGDAILLKDVLHNWSDGDCLKLLNKCLKALPDANGKVVVLDHVLPLKPDTSTASRRACQVDNIMMIATGAGRQRSQVEFEALATAAGFTSITSRCFAGGVWITEMYK